MSLLAAGALLPLSQVPQGNSDSTRVGDQLRAKHLRVALRLVGQTANTATVIRAVIFRWKPLASASIPAIASVFYESMAQDYQSAMSSLDPKNVPSQAIILADHTAFITQPYDIASGYKCFDLPLNFEQTYTGDTYCTNSIFMVLVAQGASTSSSYVYNSAFSYKD